MNDTSSLPQAPQGKTRVVILGGGPAGLASAFHLSSTPELRERYDVTVYQVGWRLGGKLCSGRKNISQGNAQIINILGTHYLFGCYSQTFDLVRGVYDAPELQGVPGFGTLQEEFIPQQWMVCMQRFQEEWTRWALPLPAQGTIPTSGPTFLSAREHHKALVELAGKVLRHKGPELLASEHTAPEDIPSRWHERLAGLEHLARVNDVALEAHRFLSAHNPFATLERSLARRSEDLLSLLEKLLASLAWQSEQAVLFILRHIRGLAWDLLGHGVDSSLLVRRVWILLDLLLTAAIGMIQDDVLGQGFTSIDDVDFREWFKRNGASALGYDSPLIHTWYDAICAFEDGDSTRPSASAGLSLNAVCSALFLSQGTFYWEMANESGEAIFAPLYQVLHDRGVKVRFFHRLWNVLPQGEFIDTLVVERQVELQDGPDSYQPFIEVKGRKVWPDQPLYGQIKTPDVEGVDFESFYTRWDKGARLELKRGRDFDQVVFALPVDTVRHYCRPLLENPKWQRMVERIWGVETQSLRLNFTRTQEQLGWNISHLVTSAYVQPYGTWEDANSLAQYEVWPDGKAPQSIATVFGPLHCPRVAPGPDDHEYPVKQHEVSLRAALGFVWNDATGLWPGSARPEDPTRFDWSCLTDVSGGAGPERFEAQQLHSNSGPVLRYTQAVPGALPYRLRPDGSGYANLKLAGDWVRNTVEIGSVEGAVRAGVLAARAIIRGGALDESLEAALLAG